MKAATAIADTARQCRAKQFQDISKQINVSAPHFLLIKATRNQDRIQSLRFAKCSDENSFASGLSPTSDRVRNLSAAIGAANSSFGR